MRLLTVLAVFSPAPSIAASQAAIPVSNPVGVFEKLALDLTRDVDTAIREGFPACCGAPEHVVSVAVLAPQVVVLASALILLTAALRYSQPTMARFSVRIRSIMARNPFDL